MMSSFKAITILENWSAARLTLTEQQWVKTAQQIFQQESNFAQIGLVFSQVPRFIRKARLILTNEEQQALTIVAPGWRIDAWTLDQLIRIKLLAGVTNTTRLIELFRNLCEHSDIRESIALYQSLIWLNDPACLTEQVKDGLRTNMVSIFSAITLHNPYPAYYFAEPAWNQMVLKAVFLELDIRDILGCQARMNDRLASMLVHFMKERQAARRPFLAAIHELLGA